MTTTSYQTETAVLIGLAIMLMSAAAADAQIYSWRAADGAFVVSDRPPSHEITTVSVPGTTQIRTTRPGTRVEEAGQ